MRLCRPAGPLDQLRPPHRGLRPRQRLHWPFRPQTHPNSSRCARSLAPRAEPITLKYLPRRKRNNLCKRLGSGCGLHASCIQARTGRKNLCEPLGSGCRLQSACLQARTGRNNLCRGRRPRLETHLKDRKALRADTISLLVVSSRCWSECSSGWAYSFFVKVKLRGLGCVCLYTGSIIRPLQ